MEIAGRVCSVRLVVSFPLVGPNGQDRADGPVPGKAFSTHLDSFLRCLPLKQVSGPTSAPLVAVLVICQC